MNFTTKIQIEKYYNQISYESKILSIGSCFSDHISEKLERYKFKQYNNPFGIIFQPDAIENIISRAIDLRLFTKADLFFDNELWHCFEVHSELNNPDAADMLLNLNGILTYLNGELKSCSHLIITLGTAWTYRFLESGNRVANCHKVPQNNFHKELISAQEITQSLATIYSKLKTFNPDVNLLFTISPVRHLKDGFVENQWSKANLISGLHTFRSQLSTLELKKAHYFPSYEIMMDDLRDYRFYTSDFLHPNELAIQYIWELFMEAYISYHAFPIMHELESIQKGLAHRPFNPNTTQHQLFVQKLHERIEQLQDKYPKLGLF
jgi:hypothetical protein